MPLGAFVRTRRDLLLSQILKSQPYVAAPSDQRIQFARWSTPSLSHASNLAIIIHLTGQADGNRNSPAGDLLSTL
jgi:hypothetical protein